MKKVILFLFFFSFAFIYCEENESFSVFGLGVNHPWIWEKSNIGDSNSSSVGFGIYTNVIGKSGWGFMANASIDFPYYIKSNVSGTTVFLNRSDYDTWFNYNFNFGAMYNFYRENNIFLGIAPFLGFGGTLIRKVDFEQGSTIIGGGIELNAIYKVNDKVGFSGGLIGQYNFYTIGSQYIGKTKIANLTGKLTQYIITPCLCLDFYFSRKN